jgi:amino acid transporter
VSLNRAFLNATATNTILRFFTGKQFTELVLEYVLGCDSALHATIPRHSHLSVHSLTFLHSILNVLAIKVFGEAEFWLSGGKVILILIVFSFTFITMCGGNPKGDAYGFRNWDHNAFKEYRSTGTLGQFEGFCAALWSASFCVTGPEYLSMVAGEARRPRIYIKAAFKTVYWRFAIFFMGGALFVGIVLNASDATLTGIVTGESSGSGTAAASPYVIAMQNMGINGLPHLVSALLVTSIFSAGNTYTFCATRSLYGLAIEGRAPKALRYCTKSGVPIVCFGIVMVFPCLAFLQVSNGSNKVLGWLINLVTAGGVINYLVMCVTYVFFYRACKAQGLDRNTLPYKGWFQPYSVSLRKQHPSILDTTNSLLRHTSELHG